jgi:hypothetical protein
LVHVSLSPGAARVLKTTCTILSIKFHAMKTGKVSNILYIIINILKTPGGKGTFITHEA